MGTLLKKTILTYCTKCGKCWEKAVTKNWERFQHSYLLKHKIRPNQKYQYLGGQIRETNYEHHMLRSLFISYGIAL